MGERGATPYLMKECRRCGQLPDAIHGTPICWLALLLQGNAISHPWVIEGSLSAENQGYSIRSTIYDEPAGYIAGA